MRQTSFDNPLSQRQGAPNAILLSSEKPNRQFYCAVHNRSLQQSALPLRRVQRYLAMQHFIAGNAGCTTQEGRTRPAGDLSDASPGDLVKGARLRPPRGRRRHKRGMFQCGAGDSVDAATLADRSVAKRRGLARPWRGRAGAVVPGGGIEPPTRGFSIRCSTN